MKQFVSHSWKRVVLASFCAVAALLAPAKSRADLTDFVQTSLPINTGTLIPGILTMIPDPTVQYSAIISYEQLIDQENDGAIIDLLFRQNAAGTGDYSGTQFVFVAPNGDGIQVAMPIAANSSNVLVASPTIDNSPSVWKFYSLPTSTFAFEYGTTAAVDQQDLSLLPSVTNADENFWDHLVSDNMGSFFFSFMDSAPFPRTNSEPGTLFAGEVLSDPNDEASDRIISYYAVGLENGLPFSATSTSVSTGYNVGPGEQRDGGSSYRNASSSTPVLADFDGDGCQDAAILVDMDDKTQSDAILALKGNCDGTFATPTVHDMGSGIVLGGAMGADINGDGLQELVFSSAVQPDDNGSRGPISGGAIKVVYAPLSSFQVTTLFSNPSGTFSAQVHSLDCNVDGHPDILTPTTQIVIDPNATSNDTSVYASDVLCFLNDGQGNFSTDSNLVIYPASKLSPSYVNEQGETQRLQSLILQSQVGPVGCGNGWVGTYLVSVDDGENRQSSGGNDTGTGFSYIITSQHSDCTSVIDALARAGGIVDDVQGGGCANLQRESEAPRAPLHLYAGLLAALAFMRLSRARSAAARK